jgi:O-palmitoleoyl-L-serine hydrolase
VKFTWIEFLLLTAIGSLLLLNATTARAASDPPQGIAQALTCGTIGGAEDVTPGNDLYRIDIDLSQYPNAVCNDGTPAAMFVRRYANEADRNKWIIFLLGGGDCGRGQACAERWCSVNTNYGEDKMSTRFLAEQSIAGNGIFDRTSLANNFAGWNQVFVYYCSSDNWQGRASNVHLAAILPNGHPVDYLINFRGSDIIDSVIGTLRRQPAQHPVKYRDIDRAERVLPDLDDATVVLFSGSSAGGNGVKNNLDRIGDIFRQTNKHGRDSDDCPLQFLGVIDANYPPSFEHLDLSQSVFCPSLCSYEAFYTNEWNQVNLDTWHARGDESCVNWHQANAPGTEWKCADPQHVVDNHLTTPLFVRQDLQDQTWVNIFAGQALTTPVAFGQLSHSQLSSLGNLDTFAEEGSTRSGGPPLRAPGIFGPQCKQHYGLTDGVAFFHVTITDSGHSYSYQDLLWNWIQGAPPQQLVHSFTGPGAAVDCP